MKKVNELEAQSVEHKKRQKGLGQQLVEWVDNIMPSRF